MFKPVAVVHKTLQQEQVCLVPPLNLRRQASDEAIRLVEASVRDPAHVLFVHEFAARSSHKP